MYDIRINGETGKNIGVYIQSRPNIPTAEKEYEEIKIPGRDGNLYKDLGTVKDIKIQITMAFREQNPDMWMSKVREVRRWLYSEEDNCLSFSDDLNYFYRVKKITIETAERIIKKQGKMAVIFLCEGYHYFRGGVEEKQLDKLASNPGEKCCPIYKIKGEGVCTITINGKPIKANVAQNLTIDTKRGIAYRENGTIQNTAISGKYQDMLLKPGENTITVSTGFILTAIPNWRCW